MREADIYVKDTDCKNNPCKVDGETEYISIYME